MTPRLELVPLRELIAMRLDLEHVRRCRVSGWHGLGQPLKSFRDSTVKFPAYRPRRRSPSLERLGPVRVATGEIRSRRAPVRRRRTMSSAGE